MFTIIGGDVCEFINRSDKRHSEEGMAKWLHGHGDIAQKQIDRAVELLAPLAKKNKVLAVMNGNHEASIAGKRTWLDRHNPGTSADAIFTGQKERLAQHGGQPNVLVDDYKKYIQSWTDAGGHAVLYRDADVDNVIKQLAEIYHIDK